MTWDQLVQISKPLVPWWGLPGYIINDIFGIPSADTCTVDRSRCKDQCVLAPCYSQLRYPNASEHCTMTFN